MGGWVTIGTKLDTKQLEKDLKASERELTNYEKEAEKLASAKAKIEIDISDYEKEIAKIKAETDKTLSLAVTDEQAQQVLLEEEKTIEAINQKYSKQFQSLEEINGKLQENAHNQGLVKNQIEETTKKLNQVKGLDSIKGGIQSIGNSMEQIVKKAVRWGLAIFSIRSAYNFLRGSISTISNYNDQISSDVEYIRFALASTLQPVIEAIIKLAYKLLAYTAYIAKAWFGVNIFANASSKAFENANNKMKKTNKNAKELNKTLAGFDEMNILQKDGGVKSGGGGGGITPPSIDLSDWENVKMPKWIELIAKNKKLILGTLAGIAAGMAAIKIAKFIKNLSSLFNWVSKVNTGMKLLKTTGIALMITGFILMIKNIADLILNWDKLDNKQKALKVTLGILGAAFIALGYAIMTGISVATLGIGALIAAIAALITSIIAVIVKIAKEENAIKSVKKAQDDLTESKKKAKEAEEEYINAVDKSEESLKALREAEKQTGLSGQELYKQVQNGTLDYKNMNEQQKQVYKAYLENKNAQDQLKESTAQLNKAKKEEKIASWDNKLALAAEKGEYDKYKKSVVDAYKSGKLSAQEARDQIGKAMSGMSRDSQKTFMKDLPSDIKNGLNPKNYETTGQRLTKWFDTLWGKIKKGSSSAWSAIKKSFGFSAGGVVYRQARFAKGGIVVPKLASGGIINQPGRGVPLASAIGGERGAEGVIPLTDSQQMALLGEAIGKYIRIDNVIDINMDSRKINRILQSSADRTNFAMNR